MEYESYELVHGDNRSRLGLALRDETSKIRKITVAPHESGDIIYLFYEKKDELVEQETERVQQLRIKAKEVSGNAVYQKLTNAKQRSLFLCEKCKVTKSEAEDIVELVKILEVEASEDMRGSVYETMLAQQEK